MLVSKGSAVETGRFCLAVKVTSINTPKSQEDEFIEIQSETGTAFQRWSIRHVTMLQQVCTPTLSPAPTPSPRFSRSVCPPRR